MANELADTISHVVRFAGDSGDGIQLQGQQFTVASALAAELPLLLVNSQRAGPSTGMPTKTEQSDLYLAIYGLTKGQYSPTSRTCCSQWKRRCQRRWVLSIGTPRRASSDRSGTRSRSRDGTKWSTSCTGATWSTGVCRRGPTDRRHPPGHCDRSQRASNTLAAPVDGLRSALAGTIHE